MSEKSLNASIKSKKLMRDMQRTNELLPVQTVKIKRRMTNEQALSIMQNERRDRDG
jgi:hypothetical protein